MTEVNHSNTIVVLGQPASGKTSMTFELPMLLGLEVYDVDREIQADYSGFSLQMLFDKLGIDNVYALLAKKFINFHCRWSGGVILLPSHVLSFVQVWEVLEQIGLVVTLDDLLVHRMARYVSRGEELIDAKLERHSGEYDRVWTRKEIIRRVHSQRAMTYHALQWIEKDPLINAANIYLTGDIFIDQRALCQKICAFRKIDLPPYLRG